MLGIVNRPVLVAQPSIELLDRAISVRKFDPNRSSRPAVLRHAVITRKGHQARPSEASARVVEIGNLFREESLRRLFSTFAKGWPGVGLLLMRLAAGAALLIRVDGNFIERMLGILLGALVVSGLWTPIAGAAVAAMELWAISFQEGDPWVNFLVASLGAALALVGPGAWSVDARLYGWKRIDIGNKR